VTLTIYNSIGETVGLLVNEFQSEGNYEVVWNAESCPSGIYFYKLQAVDPSSSSGQSFVEFKKMILIR